MSYSFVLIEQSDKTGKDIETFLQRSFPTAAFRRIDAALSNHQKTPQTEVAWASFDIILIDCSVSLERGIEFLQILKPQASKVSVILLSDQAEIKTIALQKGANESFKFQDSWINLATKINTLINLKNHLQLLPFELNDWSLLEVLHNGENSIVYKAINKEGKQVAIKRYKYKLNHLSEEYIEQFLSDLQQFSKIKTPRLVQIYDSGISENALYQVMELMPRGSLCDRLKADPHLSLPRARKWLLEIVYALHIIHEAGLLHRDLKPDNIMLRDDNSLALNDYGTATNLLVKAGFMTEEEIHCSPSYVSPERALDRPSGVTSDIYSLGIIFYELLMGDKPFHGASAMELMLQHILAPIPTFPAEYANYQPLLDKMLAKHETRRLQRVIDVASYLGG